MTGAQQFVLLLGLFLIGLAIVQNWSAQVEALI